MKKIPSKCPGQDTRNWGPEDIYDLECPSCHKPVEFFKTDVIRECPNCKEPVVNEKMDISCAEWCPAAPTCIGLEYPLKKYENEDKRKEDLKKLLTIVSDEKLKDLIKKLYDENNRDCLLDIKQLYLLKLKEPAKYEQITAALKKLVEDKRLMGCEDGKKKNNKD